MLERDYIMALIQEFTAAVSRFLEKKEVTDSREQLRKLYDKYVGKYSLYYNATLEGVMEAIQSYDPDQRLTRLDMLAELYRVEADLVSKPDRDFLLGKAYALFDYVDRNGKTLSFERLSKMQAIKAALGKDISELPRL